MVVLATKREVVFTVVEGFAKAKGKILVGG